MDKSTPRQMPMPTSRHPPKTTGLNERLLQKLQELSEMELTTTVIQPILEAMGFEKVEYYGGTDEEGKDVICWRVDEFGDIELTVAQVKLLRLSRRAADSRSLSEIVNQLSQAIEKELPYTDGIGYRPTAILLFTPYPVATKVIKSRFEAIRALRRERIKIVDGPKLVQLLQRYAPGIARQFAGPLFTLRENIASSLTNDILLKALHARTGRSIADFYTDLDLSMGKPSAQVFFHATFRPIVKELRLAPAEWRLLRTTCQQLADIADVDLSWFNPQEVEHRYAALKKSNARQRAAIRRLEAAIAEATSAIVREKGELDLRLRGIRKRTPRLATLEQKRNRISQELDRRFSKKMERERAKRRKPERINESAESLGGTERHASGTVETDRLPAPDGPVRDSLSQSPENAGLRSAGVTQAEKLLQKELASLGSEIDEITRELRSARAEIARLEGKRRDAVLKQAALQASLAEERYVLDLNGPAIAAALEKAKHDLAHNLQAIDGNLASTDALRSILIRASALFALSEKLLANPGFQSALGPVVPNPAANPDGVVRLRAPIEKVLDTGLNIVLLGDAGAGKTTSLQNYFSSRIESIGDERLLLLAPLARVIEEEREDRLYESESAGDRLERVLLGYLERLDCPLSHSDLRTLAADGRMFFLLDGLDEVVKSAPWVVAGINSVSTRYPRSQIVVSSRILSIGIEQIPFVAVTLLPFTSDQCRRFVRGWFNEEPDAATAVIAHLDSKPELDLIVRNPLLATILCVLEEHGVPLPANEPRIYEERMRLLVGDYDIHKSVHRLDSSRHLLSLASQRIAFRLHSLVRRHASPEEMLDWLKQTVSGDYRAPQLKRALAELVDPCNILLPATSDGRLGFGHLRYQEYLAARELIENRSIDLLSIIDQAWWRGTLELFAQMNRSLGWLLELVEDRYQLTASIENLRAMIARRPATEQKGLIATLEASVAEERGMVEAGVYSDLKAGIIPLQFDREEGNEDDHGDEEW